MDPVARGVSTHSRYRDAGFEQALQQWRREGRARPPTRLTFAGRPKSQLDAAAVDVAARLGAPLLRVELGAIASRYIGETEKNLDRLLARAAAADAVLLVDEADAIFGKRTTVSDSHDRYANVDLAALLARLGGYRGIVILTAGAAALRDPWDGRGRHLVVMFPPA